MYECISDFCEDNLLPLEDINDTDSVWQVVTTANRELAQRMKEEDEGMCKALAEIMKPELDEAFDNGFDNGAEDKGIRVFKNMINRGFSRKDAQSLAEISDELAERALREC